MKEAYFLHLSTSLDAPIRRFAPFCHIIEDDAMSKDLEEERRAFSKILKPETIPIHQSCFDALEKEVSTALAIADAILLTHYPHDVQGSQRQAALPVILKFLLDKFEANRHD